MTTPQSRRSVRAEAVIVVAGVATALVAGWLGWEAVFLASALVCMCAVLAMPFTWVLSARGRAAQFVAVMVGIAALAFGLWWWREHGEEPEVFSPVLLGYAGGGLALSAGLSLMRSRIGD